MQVNVGGAKHVGGCTNEVGGEGAHTPSPPPPRNSASGFMNGMSHYYLGGGRRGSSDYYRAYLGDIIWSISLILCNKIYARVAQYYILRPFEI